MDKTKIIILLFEEITALDAVGPYEVLSRIPGSEVYFVSNEPGIKVSTGGLKIFAEHSIEDVAEADILLIPGGKGVDKFLENNSVLDWIKKVHASARFTTSVCTGSLLLGAAGILNGLKATTHWNHIERLSKYGAKVVNERYVQDGKVITSAGVSAGIDMALKIVQLIKNETLAKALQLAIEYDPAPPFNTGSPAKAPKDLVELVKKASLQRQNS